jgi:hypothetical protein
MPPGLPSGGLVPARPPWPTGEDTGFEDAGYFAPLQGRKVSRVIGSPCRRPDNSKKHKPGGVGSART